MKKLDLQRLNMIRATSEFANETTDTTQNVPAFMQKVDEIDALMAQFYGYNDEVVTYIKGFAQTKATLKTNLASKTIYIINGLKAYSLEIDDQILYESIKFLPSQLDKMRDANLISLATAVSNLASPLMPNLSIYNITQVNVDEMLAARVAYMNLLATPRNKIVKRSVDLAGLRNAINKSMALLRFQLDPIAQIVKAEYAEWFARYKGARKIVDLGPHHTQIKGLVVNAAMSGIYNAKVVAKINDELIEAHTDLGGNFVIKGLKPGIYCVEISKDGYTHFSTPEFRVKLGKSSIVNTKLESEVVELKKVA